MVPALTAAFDISRVQGYDRRAVGGAAFGATLRTMLRPVAGPITASAISRPIAIPEEQQESPQDQSARRDVKALIEALEALQQDLLRSELNPSHLAKMAALADELAPADQDLAEICAAIALRVRVEAARLQRPALRR